MPYTRRIVISGKLGFFATQWFGTSGQILKLNAAGELPALRDWFMAAYGCDTIHPSSEVDLVLHALMRAAERLPAEERRVDILLPNKLARVLEPPHEGGGACSP